MKPGVEHLLKNLRRWLPGIFISVVALIIVFQLAEWKDLGKALHAIQPLNMFIALILGLLATFFRARAWNIMLGGNVSSIRTFFIVNIGYLMNYVFPLRAGEIGRALLMGKASQKGPFFVLSTIVIERALDVTVAGGLLAASLPFILGMGADWATTVALTTLALVVAGFFALYLMARNQERISRWVGKIGERSSFLRRWIIPQIDSLFNGLRILTDIKQFIKCIFWILICWVCYLGCFYVLLLQVSPGAPFWWTIFGQSVVALGIAIPSAPGALGVYEASVVAAMSVVGVPSSAALAFALIMHLMTYVENGLCGLWGLAREGSSLGSLFDEIRLREVEKNPTN